MAASFVCPFCGLTGKSSNEHVLGQQFSQHFPSVAQHIAQVGDFAPAWSWDQVVQEGDDHVVLPVTRESKTPELHQVKVNVCTKCNHGWMAEYDNTAVVVLKALAGRRLLNRPTAAQAEALWQWLCKMALAYDLFLPSAHKAYTDDLRRGFHATRELIPGTTVYLGHEPDQPWLSYWQQGWHVTPHGTPHHEIVNAAPNLSTTFLALDTMRLIAHRVSPTLEPKLHWSVHAWLRKEMVGTGMLSIAPSALTGWPLTGMPDNAILQALYALHRLVDQRFSSVVRRAGDAAGS